MLHSFEPASLTVLQKHEIGEPTDEQLLQNIQMGDEAALAILHDRHNALLRTLIMRMVNNFQDVDDLVQECLLEIWKHASNYSADKGHALGWIVTLARRRTIDRIRRKSAYSRAQDRFRQESTMECDDDANGADEEVSTKDRAEAVAGLIAKLPEAQQEAVRLTFYCGMTQREIAAHTHIPLGTIKTRLELAFRKLRSSAVAFGELHEPMQAAA